MSSRKSQQMASTLREALTEQIARGLSDPRLEGVLLTVTAVRVSADLRDAGIGVSVLPEKHQARALAALRHAASHLRREVGRRTDLSNVPTLHFDLDTSLKKQAGVIESLNRARAERGAGAGDGGAYTETGPESGENQAPPASTGDEDR